MSFKHTKRPGFLLGFVDFFTAGLFFLLYMPLGGLQREPEDIPGHKVRPYWQAYLLGILTMFIYTLIWMARISEELIDDWIRPDTRPEEIVPYAINDMIAEKTG